MISRNTGFSLFTKKVFRSFSTTKTRDVQFFKSSTSAVRDIPNKATVLFGGFGLAGIPENLIQGLVNTGVRDLTAISNGAGTPDFGLGLLLRNHQIKRMVSSYVASNPECQRQYLAGELEMEFTPQGTLAERARAGGAGIPAFYTPTGYATVLQSGDIPIKLTKDGRVAIPGEPKEMRIFNGHYYLLERAIKADFALIKAWKADGKGNLVLRKTARNFNVPFAKAARITIAEVEEIVETGEIDPDDVHIPGLYVNRILEGQTFEHKIEILRYATDKDHKGHPDPLKNRIVRRAALEMKDGMVVNLGVGIPQYAADYLPDGVNVTLQSENGVLGLGPYPNKEEVDSDLINAGKETATVVKGGAFFASDESFAMIRGGHIGCTMLGAFQVSKTGDLANFMIPGKSAKGMGGAMDLVSPPGERVVITMTHTNKGKPKILDQCTLPLTAKGVVSRIITDMCVFDIDPNFGIILKEIAAGVTLEQVKASTGCDFVVAESIIEMPQAS